jgi:exoribonuclease II
LQMTKETLRYNTNVNNDIDDRWNIRQDLRHLKIYTIDSESTTEVDDGISLQVLEPGRYRYWIHIADADRWAPRGSDIFRIAQARTTTHYLPTGPIPMFPPM